MKFFLTLSALCLTALLHNILLTSGQDSQGPQTPAERTRKIALIFSLMQCFNASSDSPEVLGLSAIRHANRHFNPEEHLDKYHSRSDVLRLVEYLKKVKASGTPTNTPFTTDPTSINNFQIILRVLFLNADNWQLFYDTVAYLLGRANSSSLFWAVMIVCAEKFGDSVTVPATAEVFPQLYIPKEWVLQAAGRRPDGPPLFSIPDNPLRYWMTDPDLHDFHTHFHMDMPFWWSTQIYNVPKFRKGEIFLFMHHQMINRYNTERQCHGLEDAVSLQLRNDFQIRYGYRGDIVDTDDFKEYPSRPPNVYMGNFSEQIRVTDIDTMCQRVITDMNRGYFIRTVNGRTEQISLRYENGTDILGATAEASNVYSVNYQYYGSCHNWIHQFLSGTLRTVPMQQNQIPGVQAHQETSMRDPLFYQIHSKIDDLYKDYKAKRDLVPPYTKADLEFTGVSVVDVKILTCSRLGGSQNSWLASIFGSSITWPFLWQQQSTPTLTTFMSAKSYDISTAARPCRSVNDPPVIAQVETLGYVPFNYVISINSYRPTVSYGMVRIFLWPEFNRDGTPLEGDAAHVRAIELDRFRVRIDPNRVTVITRSSLNSSLTRPSTSPGIKTLYNVRDGSELLTNPEIRRACGFPNNMLLPRGSPQGMSFKLTVFISDETAMGAVSSYPHYPLCGALHGLPFPDRRAMGFPFDRPGTDFNVGVGDPNVAAALGCSKMMMTNVKQLKVVIKHDATRRSKPFM